MTPTMSRSGKINKNNDQSCSITSPSPDPMYQAVLHQGLGIIKEQISEAVRHRT